MGTYDDWKLATPPEYETEEGAEHDDEDGRADYLHDEAEGEDR